MKNHFGKLSFFVTLLTVLLISHAAGVLGVQPTQVYQATSISQETAPDLTLESIVSRVALPRLHAPEPQAPKPDPVPWPLLIISLALLSLAVRFPLHHPRHYLTQSSHRIAGWRDTNLQFRFIHTR